jgi:predicted transcriptional regulator
MRTTVDLPPAVHRRARDLARRRGVSMSAVVAELTVRGLAQVDTTVELAVDERSGLPVLSLGRVVTAEEVADAMDDE